MWAQFPYFPGTMGAVPRRETAPSDPSWTSRQESRAVVLTGRGRLALAAALVLVMLLVALFAWPGWARDSASSPDGGSGSATASLSPSAEPTPTSDDDAVELTDGTVAALDSALGGSTAEVAGAVVLDPHSGEPLYERMPDEQLVPASNQKLLTELSLLHFLDPQKRLATTVVRGNTPDTLVLVGGGDSLLAPGLGDSQAVEGRAGIADLARQTAQNLELDAGVSSLTVDVDASMFTGTGINEAWLPGDIASGEVGPVSPLAFASHRAVSANGQQTGGYDSDAAQRVADVYAAALSDELTQRSGRAMTVQVGAMVDTSADPLAPADRQQGVTEVARVESATVGEQATVMMGNSDNRLSETLCRVSAVAAGEAGDSDGARTAVTRALEQVLGENTVQNNGVVISDCAGVSAENRVPAAVIGDLLLDSAQHPQAGHGVMLSTLPTAGESGTLTDRFQAPEAAAGRGNAQAKTGTLRGVTALSGQVRTADGEALIAVVLLNGTTDQTAARNSTDRFFAALAQN